MKTHSTYIPMFPLQTILLVGERMPLHVFEPRYKQLFNEAEEGDTNFGLPYTDKSRDIQLVSICKLVETTKRYRDGRRDVIIEAFRLCQLGRTDNIYSGKPYPGGEVMEELEPAGKTTADITLLDIFADYVEARAGRRPAYAVLRHYTVNDIAISIGLDADEKIRYLLKSDDAKRTRFLYERLLVSRFLLFQSGKVMENGVCLN